MGGAYTFYEDLRFYLDARIRYSDAELRIVPNFAKLSSYKGLVSSHRLQGEGTLDAISIMGKNVLIVEDMIDSGFTMKSVLLNIRSRNPKKLKVAVAFHKKNPQNIENGYFADYTGFLVPQKFCIGYGLDYNQHFRDLPHLCEINFIGIEKFRN